MAIGMPELFYYAESEGLLPTRQGKINAVIRKVRTYDPTNFTMNELAYLLDKHNINIESLSSQEKRYIEACLN
jgi:glycine cleavage system regulatory protein